MTRTTAILRNWANALLLTGITYFVTIGVVLAHSGLKRAEPSVGSTLKRAPSEVKLFFSEQVEAAYSTIQVVDGKGERVDKNDSRLDRSAPVLLRTSLRPLKTGTYTVIWRVLSVDSHVTEGRFTFTVQ